jgi:hypothetical protein
VEGRSRCGRHERAVSASDLIASVCALTMRRPDLHGPSERPRIRQGQQVCGQSRDWHRYEERTDRIDMSPRGLPMDEPRHVPSHQTAIAHSGGQVGLGQAVPRLEDERLLRGGSRFVSDLIATSKALHVKVVRSPMPTRAFSPSLISQSRTSHGKEARFDLT